MAAAPLPDDQAGPATAQPPEVDVEAVGRRVEELLQVIGTAEPAARTAAEDLLRELLGLYGVALERLVGALATTAPDVMGRLAEDPLLAGLLVLHDLHPLDARARVQQAVAGFPDVTVTAVTDEAAYLAIAGTCGATAVPTDVEQAVRAAAPELTRVVVDDGGHANGLIPPSALTTRRTSA